MKIVSEYTDQINAHILPYSQDKVSVFFRPPFHQISNISASLLAQRVGAERVKLMPAKGIFALGVGHVRRKILEPGARSETPAQMMSTEIVGLSEIEWRVLVALKREFAPEEIRSNPWAGRA